MNLGLKGKTAVVGGASSGLGRASAEALAEEGCDLLLWARNRRRLETVAREIARLHAVDVHVATADASTPQASEAIANAVTATIGHADILILNAGGPPPADPLSTDPDAWRHAFQLLALTPIQLATALLPSMQARQWGRVVAILSSGIRQPIGRLAYSNACRSALASWMKTAADPLAADNVTINGVIPGRIDTERVAQLDTAEAERVGTTIQQVRQKSQRSIPSLRYGRPDELASAVAYLASSQASYQTGSFITVDGGSIRST